MVPFALPYDPSVAPVENFNLTGGYDFAPAHFPADLIGPVMWCPMAFRAPDADMPLSSKYDARAVDVYAHVDDLPSILPAAAPKLVAAYLNPAPAAYAASWGGSSFGGGSWGGSRGDTIIGGTSSTTIIRKVIHKDGDTIIIKYPDPWEPCGCIEEPELPPIAPIPLDASAGFLLIALAILYRRRIWRAVGRFGDWFCAERGTGPGQCGWL